MCLCLVIWQREAEAAQALLVQAKHEVEQAHRRTSAVEEAQASVFSEAMRKAKASSELAAKEAEDMINAARRGEAEGRQAAVEAKKREEVRLAEARIETARWYAAAQAAQKEADGAWLAEKEATRLVEEARRREAEAVASAEAAFKAASDKAAGVERAAMQTLDDRLRESSIQSGQAITEAQNACDAARGVSELSKRETMAARLQAARMEALANARADENEQCVARANAAEAEATRCREAQVAAEKQTAETQGMLLEAKRAEEEAKRLQAVAEARASADKRLLDEALARADKAEANGRARADEADAAKRAELAARREADEAISKARESVESATRVQEEKEAMQREMEALQLSQLEASFEQNALKVCAEGDGGREGEGRATPLQAWRCCSMLSPPRLPSVRDYMSAVTPCISDAPRPLLVSLYLQYLSSSRLISTCRCDLSTCGLILTTRHDGILPLSHSRRPRRVASHRTRSIVCARWRRSTRRLSR